jgi:hypothetical protein
MRCLSWDEYARYGGGFGFAIGGRGVRIRAGGRDHCHSAWLQVPDSSTRQRALSDRLIELYGTSKGLLLWVCQENASWSDEYAEVLRQIRLAEGEERPLADAPGHLFAENEEGLARGMVLLLLALRWNACLALESKLFVAFLSQGDGMTIVAGNPATLSEVISKLAGGGFRLDREPA